MSRLATSFVLGYHGCSQTTANKALKGKTELLYQKTWAMTHRAGLLVSRAGVAGRPRAKKDSYTKGHFQCPLVLLSEMPYDWLGPGVYFWENDPQRALEFAYWKSSRDAQFTNPTVIGAVIDLGNCFDLISRESIEALKAAYNSFADFRTKDGKEIPKNKNGKNLDEDRSLRFLDYAVIKHFYELADAAGLPAYDTARGMFAEGDVIYQGAGFREKNHVQIAVKNPSCIKGFFVPRPFPTIR